MNNKKYKSLLAGLFFLALSSQGAVAAASLSCQSLLSQTSAKPKSYPSSNHKVSLSETKGYQVKITNNISTFKKDFKSGVTDILKRKDLSSENRHAITLASNMIRENYIPLLRKKAVQSEKLLKKIIAQWENGIKIEEKLLSKQDITKSEKEFYSEFSENRIKFYDFYTYTEEKTPMLLLIQFSDEILNRSPHTKNTLKHSIKYIIKSELPDNAPSRHAWFVNELFNYIPNQVELSNYNHPSLFKFFEEAFENKDSSILRQIYKEDGEDAFSNKYSKELLMTYTKDDKTTRAYPYFSTSAVGFKKTAELMKLGFSPVQVTNLTQEAHLKTYGPGAVFHHDLIHGAFFAKRIARILTSKEAKNSFYNTTNNIIKKVSSLPSIDERKALYAIQFIILHENLSLITKDNFDGYRDLYLNDQSDPFNATNAALSEHPAAARGIYMYMINSEVTKKELSIILESNYYKDYFTEFLSNKPDDFSMTYAELLGEVDLGEKGIEYTLQSVMLRKYFDFAKNAVE